MEYLQSKNKRPKRDMAERMMSKKEKKDRVSPFSCKAWINRSDFIKKRLLKKVTKK